MPAHRSFLKHYLVGLALLVTLIATINLLVDPLGIYRLVALEGVNANKPYSRNHDRLIKPYLAGRLALKGLVAGSSRVQVGIDPAASCWPESHAPAYNFGVPGAKLDELTRYLEDVLPGSDLSLLVVGLDFFMFNGGTLSAYSSDHHNLLAYHTKALFSVETLKFSLKTLYKQDENRYPGLRSSGQMSWLFGKKELARHGQRQDFLAYEKRIIEENAGLGGSLADYCTRPDGSSSLDDLTRLIELCKTKQIRLVLFISPTHVRRLVAFDQIGVYPLFNEWKRELTRITERHQSSEAPTALELWDFSGPGRLTTETVPTATEIGREMTYFLENSHYRNALGNLLLCRIFGCPDCDAGQLAGFGVRLTGQNLADVLAAQQQALAAYQLSHQQDLQDLYDLVRSFSPAPTP